MSYSIKTYKDLLELVEKDSESHKLKEIAEIFLNAMNDWPTSGLESIEEFMIELKNLFGFPLTLEKIDSKKIDLSFENNAWRAEAKSQICEMIEYSKLYFNESNFESMVSKIIEYYSNPRASR